MIPVTAGILIKDKTIFVARRAASKPLAGFWEFPGGKVEGTESFVGCLKREWHEEFGVSIDVKKYFMRVEWTETQMPIALHAYLVAWRSGEFELRDHDASMWLKIQELGSVNWAPADRPIVDRLLQSDINSLTARW